MYPKGGTRSITAHDMFEVFNHTSDVQRRRKTIKRAPDVAETIICDDVFVSTIHVRYKIVAV